MATREAIGGWAASLIGCLLIGVPSSGIVIDFDIAGDGDGSFDRIFDSAFILEDGLPITGTGLPYDEEGFLITGVDTGDFDYRFYSNYDVDGAATVPPIGIHALGWKQGTSVDLTQVDGNTFTLVDFYSSNAVFDQYGDLALTVTGTFHDSTVPPETVQLGMNAFTQSGGLNWTGLTSVRFTAPPDTIAALDSIQVLDTGPPQPIPDASSTGALFAGVLLAIGWMRRRLD